MKWNVYHHQYRLGCLIVSLLHIAQVKGQGRFLDDLLKWRVDTSVLTEEAVKNLLQDLAERVFAPHDNNDIESLSNIYLVQQDHPRLQQYNQTLATDNEIEFRTYDFAVTTEEGGPVGDFFREEVKMLREQEEAFNTHITEKDPLDVDIDHVKRMLSSVLTMPRSHQFDESHNSTLKQDIGGYIWAKMGLFGFVTGVQAFQDKRVKAAPQGTNIVGIMPGTYWGTPEDKVVVVGAHWDTVADTGGLDDNGGGVAALLELARALHMANCSNTFTLVMVAFDLEELGTHGSTQFVQDLLIPRLLTSRVLNTRSQFTGAIILDCNINYDDEDNSQDMEQDWWTIVPSAAKSITQHKRRGNFLAALGRNLPGDQFLAETFHNNFKLSSPPDSMRFENFLMEGMSEELVNISVIAQHLNLLRSDHSAFWIVNNRQYYASLPAILLSDLGPYRGYMRQCYHSKCDVYREDKVNWKFIKHTFQALIDTVIQISDSKCDSNRKFEEIKRPDQTNLFLFETDVDPLKAEAEAVEDAVRVEIVENHEDEEEKEEIKEEEKSSSSVPNQNVVFHHQVIPRYYYYPQIPQVYQPHHHPLVYHYPLYTPLYAPLLRHCYPYC